MMGLRSMLPLPLLVCSLSVPAQTSAGVYPGARMPPDYRGPMVRLQGIFVTPVAGSPFTAKVDIVSTQVLPDGSSVTRTTVNHIARDSRGRIYNERRRLVPATYKGDPELLESHVFDPSTRLNTFVNPFTHIAREAVLPPRSDPAANPQVPRPGAEDQDLGTQFVSGVAMHGTRKSRLVPATASLTGKEVTVSDEYWYSPDLSIDMLIKHEDIRTGTQLVAVSEVERHEPDPAIFLVPKGYKVVDETPVPLEAEAAPAR